VFLDAGSLWNLNKQEPGIAFPAPSFSDMRYNPGFGLRVKLPIIMISADIGFPLNHYSDDKSSYALHLNVGQAF
jgi:outer membrane protein assembly factor BamA